MAEFLEQAIENRRVDKFPYTKLAPEQFRMLDEHLQAATRISRNCESLRDPLELKYIQEIATKMYAGLDLQAPTIYILDSEFHDGLQWCTMGLQGVPPRIVGLRVGISFYKYGIHCDTRHEDQRD